MAYDDGIDEFEYELVREGEDYGGLSQEDTTVVLPVTIRVYAYHPPMHATFEHPPEGEEFSYEAHVEGKGITLSREEEEDVKGEFLRRLEQSVDPTEMRGPRPVRHY